MLKNTECFKNEKEYTSKTFFLIFNCFKSLSKPKVGKRVCNLQVQDSRQSPGWRSGLQLFPSREGWVCRLWGASPGPEPASLGPSRRPRPARDPLASPTLPLGFAQNPPSPAGTLVPCLSPGPRVSAARSQDLALHLIYWQILLSPFKVFPELAPSTLSSHAALGSLLEGGARQLAQWLWIELRCITDLGAHFPCL